MGTALFERLSCLNHSCDPNAEVCVCMHAQHTVIASATQSDSLGNTQLQPRPHTVTFSVAVPRASMALPTQVWPSVDGSHGARIVARRAIARGAEVTISYIDANQRSNVCARPAPPRPNACVSVHMCARPGPIFVCMQIHHADMYLYIRVLTSSRAVRDFALRLGSDPDS